MVRVLLNMPYTSQTIRISSSPVFSYYSKRIPSVSLKSDKTHTTISLSIPNRGYCVLTGNRYAKSSDSYSFPLKLSKRFEYPILGSHIISKSSISLISRSFHSSRSLEKRDYYEILGIERSASKDDIKKKFRELAKKYHPDLNQDDKSASDKFKEINEAYEVLSDDKKKQVYDNFGHQGVDSGFGDNQNMGENPFGQGFAGFTSNGFEFRTTSGNIDAEDLFEMFGIRMRPPSKGRDVNASVKLSFLEAVNGCTKEVKYDYVLRENNRTSGKRKTRTAKVDIPPGVDNGMTIKVSEQGEEGLNGKPPGDLYVTLEVTNDTYFKRDGSDVIVDIPITVSQAMLGGNVEVLTLDGMVDLKVPAGSQPDAKLVMRGKGIRRLNDSFRRGNQIVNLKIKIPTKLTEKQKELMKEFEQEEKQSSPEGATATSRSFSLEQAWKRLKEYMQKTTSEEKKQTEKQGA